MHGRGVRPTISARSRTSCASMHRCGVSCCAARDGRSARAKTSSPRPTTSSSAIRGAAPAERTLISYERAKYLFERWKVVDQLPQPVIAAIHGLLPRRRPRDRDAGRHPHRGDRRHLRAPSGHAGHADRRWCRSAHGQRARCGAHEVVGDDRPALRPDRGRAVGPGAARRRARRVALDRARSRP